MALPELTPEQRAAAMEKAKAARKLRSEWIADIKAGKITIEEALETEHETLKKTRVAQLLRAIPGWGKIGVDRLMAELEIPENRKVGGLGRNQKAAIVERVRK